MLVVFGRRMLGKCDAVPGMFHVATEFFHIDYVPLVPLKSYVILSRQGKSFHGMPIPLSFKSVGCAWGRALTLIGTIVGACLAAAEYSRYGPLTPDRMVPAIVAGMGALAFVFLMWHPACTKASFERACQLGQALQMNQAGMQKLHGIYGESAGRGFAVVRPEPLPEPVRTAAPVGITYPCRVCQQNFTFEHVYAEPGDKVICKTCWQTTE